MSNGIEMETMEPGRLERLRGLFTKKRILWAVALLLVGALIVPRLFSGEGDGVETVTVAYGDVIEYVSETGKVVAVDDLDLFFVTTGRVSKIHVEEGEAVEAGQVLMNLDAGQLYISRQNAVATLAGSQAQYDKALAGATPEEIRIAEIAVENARATLISAEQTLQDTKSSNLIGLEKAHSDLIGYVESVYLKSSTAMQTLENNVFSAAGNLRYDITPSDTIATSEAATTYRVAQAAMDRMHADILVIRTVIDGETVNAIASAIIADGKAVRDAAAKATALMQNAIPAAGLSQTTFDARVAAVKLAWVEANTAVNAAESQKAFVSTTKITNLASENTARQKVTTAEGALRTSEEQLQRLKAPLRDVDKAVYLASIASSRASVSLIDKQIYDTFLRSPVAGVVGSLDVSVGELVSPSFRAASVISKTFLIESDVSELDIAKIFEGQQVEVTFDALEGQVFMGKIASIAPRETTAADLDIFYTVKISLDDMDTPLRSGMTADLDINVGERSDVIIVPRRQVLRKGGKNFVKLLGTDEEFEERDVVIGLRGDNYYEILEGLNEGDVILVE